MKITPNKAPTQNLFKPRIYTPFFQQKGQQETCPEISSFFTPIQSKFNLGQTSNNDQYEGEISNIVASKNDKIIQLSGLDSATNISITPEWAKMLSDNELVEKIGEVRGQMLQSNPGEETHENLRGNLTILEHEMENRPRSIGELAENPLPTATIVLVGSPTNNTADPEHDRSPYNFSNSAVDAIPKIKANFPNTVISILFFSSGYNSRGDEVYKKASDDLKASGENVIEVDNVSQVIDFLNKSLISPIDNIPTRAVKVSQFFYFGHGTSDELLLNFGWENAADSFINKSDIVRIKTEAFDPKGNSYIFTCHTADQNDSFMSIWYSHIGQISIGPQGVAAYNYKYNAKDLEKSINKRLPKWFLGLPYMNQVKILGP